MLRKRSWIKRIMHPRATLAEHLLLRDHIERLGPTAETRDRVVELLRPLCDKDGLLLDALELERAIEELEERIND
jgi:hypothetical protein